MRLTASSLMSSRFVSLIIYFFVSPYHNTKPRYTFPPTPLPITPTPPPNTPSLPAHTPTSHTSISPPTSTPTLKPTLLHHKKTPNINQHFILHHLLNLLFFSSTNDLDTSWVGTKLPKSSSKTSRIWIQNINVINASYNFLSYQSAILDLQRYSVELFSFTETKLNIYNFHNSDSLKTIHQLALPGSFHVLSNPKTHHNTSPIHGNTLTISNDKLASRFASSGTDRFGRYNWMQFYGKTTHLKYKYK